MTSRFFAIRVKSAEFFNIVPIIYPKSGLYKILVFARWNLFVTPGRNCPLFR